MLTRTKLLANYSAVNLTVQSYDIINVAAKGGFYSNF